MQDKPLEDLGSPALADIVDAREIQALFDRFHAVAPMPMFLIDIKGEILAGAGWQDICTRFHRVHPDACRACVESDTEYSTGIPEGEYRIYRCKNNMWSVATPIHMGGRHVGNLFSGQFFFTGEEPDLEVFRAQAARYGFPERDYLAALGRAPRLSRAFVAAAMEFYLKLAANIAKASWSNVCLARSVAERGRAADDLSRVNRVLRARSRCDQALMLAVDEDGFLGEACKILMEDCGHVMLWIGYAEPDGAKTVRPVACAGYEAGYLETLQVTWDDKPRGRGPTGTAIRTGKPSVCRNIPTDARFKPWRAQALERGYASSVGLPLMADGRTFGAVTVYSKDPNAFTDEEVRLLSGQADDLAFSIGALRMRAARQEAETRFQQAQKMEAVGLLAGGIAHDFNNILATIVGYNSMLLDGLKGSELRAYSLEIKHSSELAAKLTQQLLGVSGNRGAQRRLLDPNSVITAMAKMLRRLLGEKIALALKLHRSAWRLNMASGQLEQIVMNLAVNARDAMPRGGKLVLATGNVVDKRTRCIALEVRDNGAGMDAAVQARIFEPFFTTKGPGRGTGLGLSTVKSIVVEYGGRIAVRSKPGRGSVFRILLPSAAGGEKDMAPGGRIKKSQRGRETILVVEDNGSLITVLELTLRRAGYAVLTARTAEEALILSSRAGKKFDLLLADVVLPDMDGLELAKRLKRTRPGMRTVYMSGYPGNALAPVAGFAGCVLLEKPFSPAQMLNAVRKMLDIAQGDLF